MPATTPPLSPPPSATPPQLSSAPSRLELRRQQSETPPTATQGPTVVPQTTPTPPLETPPTSPQSPQSSKSKFHLLHPKINTKILVTGLITLTLLGLLGAGIFAAQYFATNFMLRVEQSTPATATPTPPIPTPELNKIPSDWQIYLDQKYDLSFNYPASYSASLISSTSDSLLLNISKISTPSSSQVTPNESLDLTIKFIYQPEEAQFFQDHPATESILLGNSTWSVYRPPSGYGLQIEKGKTLYSIFAPSQTELTPTQKQIITSLNYISGLRFTAPTPAPTIPPTWKSFTNAVYGFGFKYPAELIISGSDTQTKVTDSPCVTLGSPPSSDTDFSHNYPQLTICAVNKYLGKSLTLDQITAQSYAQNTDPARKMALKLIEKPTVTIFKQFPAISYSITAKGSVSYDREYIGYQGTYKYIFVKTNSGVFSIRTNDTEILNQVFSTIVLPNK